MRLDRVATATLGLMMAASLNGCAVLLVGAGAAGGYSVSRDSVIAHYDLSKDHIFRRSLYVAREHGQVGLEDPKHGLIELLTPEGVKVRISVKQLTPKTVELRVKARKNMLPKVDVAQEIFNKITQGL